MKMQFIAAALVFVAGAAAATPPPWKTQDARRVFGVPSDYKTVTCGGGNDMEGKPIPKWKCVVWTYEAKGGDKLELLFDVDSGVLSGMNAKDKTGKKFSNKSTEAVRLWVQVHLEMRPVEDGPLEMETRSLRD